MVKTKGGADKVPRLGLVSEYGFRDEEVRLYVGQCMHLAQGASQWLLEWWFKLRL